MAIPGELSGLTGATCTARNHLGNVCNTKLHLQVCVSAAGYYLGYECPHHGPYSRETAYFRTQEAAEQELVNFNAGIAPPSRRDINYAGYL